MLQQLSRGEFYGETLATREVASFVLIDTIYRPGLKIPVHSHDHAFFCLVRHGTFSEVLGKTVRICKPATINFHPAGELHSDSFNESGGHCLNLQIAPQWTEQSRLMLNRSAQFHDGVLLQLGARLYKEMYEQDECSSLVIEGLILEILGETTRNQSHPLTPRCPKWLAEVRDIIKQHFAEPLSLSQISGMVDMHPTHVARAFRQYHRCTVGDYVRRTRVDFACHQLSVSDEPIVDIAYRAGFSDHGHFCKTFKRLTGQTPTQFRSRCR
jgi:AraC family transcriptional regulator